MPRPTDPPLQKVYDVLREQFGPQHWWPAERPDEVVIGAILVQNTAWANAVKAIDQLKQRAALDWRVLHETPADRLAEWIRPAGCYNRKARQLKTFAACLIKDHGGRLARLFDAPDEQLRERLLAIWGIGPETADCILLYAAGRPVFVVDTYTRRLMTRHNWAGADRAYEVLSRIFTLQLQGDAEQYGEFHALIVELGKQYCRAKPLCEACPLKQFLPKQ